MPSNFSTLVEASASAVAAPERTRPLAAPAPAEREDSAVDGSPDAEVRADAVRNRA